MVQGKRWCLFRFMGPDLITDILPVSQQFPILVQLSIMFSDSLGDSFPCRLQVIKCLHHQFNFCHVTHSIWDQPDILPSELDLAKP